MTSSRVKIVLSVDSITSPLTGIGRYTWELAKRLPESPEIGDILYFAHARFISRKALLSIAEELPLTASRIQWNVLSAMRRRLSVSTLASEAYGRLMPVVGKFRLRSYSGYLFHSPGYLLPPFDGRSIATIHDLSAFRHPQWQPESRVARMNAAINETLGRASHLITDSEAVRQEVIDYFGWPPAKVTAIPLGVSKVFHQMPPSETKPVLAKFGLTHGSYALCVATIEPRKNIDKLINAFEMIPAALRQEYPLVITGDRGWKSDLIHKQIDAARRKGWLRYLGYVPESSLPALYSGCRAFLYPSLYEGFGLPLLEAMACGAPVMTSNRSCMPEVAGHAGLLVEPEDIHSIAEGIERVITDDQWRSSAVKLGIERSQMMTWDATTQKTIDLYRKVWDNNHL